MTDTKQHPGRNFLVIPFSEPAAAAGAEPEPAAGPVVERVASSLALQATLEQILALEEAGPADVGQGTVAAGDSADPAGSGASMPAAPLSNLPGMPAPFYDTTKAEVVNALAPALEAQLPTASEIGLYAALTAAPVAAVPWNTKSAAVIEPMAVTVDDVLAALDPFAYISGRAGTGKTTLARMILEAREDCVLCATTGIAAVNLGNAVTLNSLLAYFDTSDLVEKHARGFLQLRLQKLRQAGIRILLVDEVSMLPAPQLECLVEAIEMINGSVGYDREMYRYDEDEDIRMKLLLVGDFAQLPPVNEKYAFESEVWDRFASSTLRLEKVWRQSDREFADALHAVRQGQPSSAVGVLKPKMVPALDINFDGTTIVSKNDMVDAINNRRHAGLPGDPLIWKTVRSGEQQPEWKKQIPEQIAIKPGALVMCLFNRPKPSLGDGPSSDYFYVNGDLGYVEDMDFGPAVGVDGQVGTEPRAHGIKVKINRTGEVVTVVPVTKEWTEPVSPPRFLEPGEKPKPGEILGRSQGKPAVTKQIKGAVTYLPLRLAYATTVHKSQGLSLDRVQVAIGDWMFSKPGMTYVAFSRCRTLEGLRIVGNDRMFMGKCAVDPKVARFL